MNEEIRFCIECGLDYDSDNHGLTTAHGLHIEMQATERHFVSWIMDSDDINPFAHFNSPSDFVQLPVNWIPI
jgi:hypothetical protein